MYKISAALRLMGDKFSPKIVEEKTGITFTEKNEIGDIGTKGMNRGKPIPYGSATLYPPIEVINPEYYYSGFDWIISKLDAVVKISREYGADDIYLDLAVFHKYQCNMAFDPHILAEIAKANIPFWISCYQDDELEDDVEESSDMH